MIGRLPTSLEISGKEYKIRTDYRDCILILQAFADVELTLEEKAQVLLEVLYLDTPEEANLQEAYDKAVWFLNCGDKVVSPVKGKPLYDFEQDEQIIFSAVNKVAGKEVRELEYMHFWTFISLFNEIGEGTFSTIVSIRNNRNKGNQLENHEKEFYRNNRELVDLKRKYTGKELEQLNVLNALLGK